MKKDFIVNVIIVVIVGISILAYDQFFGTGITGGKILGVVLGGTIFVGTKGFVKKFFEK